MLKINSILIVIIFFYNVHGQSNECTNVICLNGGICRNWLQNSNIPCLCRPGFGGKYCEKKKNDIVAQSNRQLRQSVCSTSTCQNSGYCMEFVGTAICFCQSGFGGQFCEQAQTVPASFKDPCTFFECQNGGSCRSYGFILGLCVCPSGYRGKLCEISTSN